MTKKLSQVAEVKTGMFAKPGTGGEVVYLQSRHFDESGELETTLEGDLRADGHVRKHLLKPGDVLFAAKGSKNFATVYKGGVPAVASTTFLVVRIRETPLLPEFLVWQLNDPMTKSFLQGQAMGSAIASISKSVLSGLEISIPSVERQRQVLEISRLNDREHNLRLEIAELRQRQIQQQIKNAIE